MQFFALTFRGLESVLAGELAALPNVSGVQTDYRRATGVVNGSPASLLSLRTADDVFLQVATWDDVQRPRSALALLTAESARLDLEAAIHAVAAIRPLPPSPAFSVTASFVGKRNYTTDEMKQAVAQGVQQRYNWRYTLDDADADLNLRLFIEHETALVGLRLGRRPLHDRPYKQALGRGSLNPPVAAALLRLADAGPGTRIVDPCCGSGTILAEAAVMGFPTLGGDIDAAALENTKANLAFTDPKVVLARWDARRLPLPDHSISRLVSNLPWGHQVTPDTDLPDFYARTCAEIQRVLAPGGRAVLLTTVPVLVALPTLSLEWQQEISLFGQTPTILVFGKSS